MPRQVIDVHCHMFSALSLPIEGILRELADEDDGYCILKPAKRRLAKNLAQMVTLLAQSAQTWNRLLDEDWPAQVNAARSLDDIATLLNGLVLRESKRRRTAALKLVSGADDEIVSVIGELMDLTGQGKAFSVLSAAHVPGLPAVNLLKGKMFEQTVALAIKAALKKLFGKAANVLRQLRFLLMLLLPEKRIAAALVDAYADVRTLATLEHFVPLMMDMEPAYERYHGAPPVFDYVERQIPLMGEVMRAHPKRLLGFVAFDPRRSRMPNGAVVPARPLEIVRKGLDAGNIGVKYYPSMGYHPAMAEYSKEHRLLFEFCAKNSVPILLHCQWGSFKADNTWDKNTDPYHWRGVLRKYGGLRVCFGHAGGGIHKFRKGETVWGWFSRTPAQWDSSNCLARKVVEVCTEYDGAYCDLSIFSEFMDGYDARPDNAGGRLTPGAAVAAFQTRLERLIAENPVLARKIMYGSDWHMPSMLGRSSQYLRIMMEMFQCKGLRDHAEAFFYENAARFLNLPSNRTAAVAGAVRPAGMRRRAPASCRRGTPARASKLAVPKRKTR